MTELKSAEEWMADILNSNKPVLGFIKAIQRNAIEVALGEAAASIKNYLEDYEVCLSAKDLESITSLINHENLKVNYKNS